MFGEQFDEFGSGAGVHDKSDINASCEQKLKIVEGNKCFAAKTGGCVVCNEQNPHSMHAGPGFAVSLRRCCRLGIIGRSSVRCPIIS